MDDKKNIVTINSIYKDATFSSRYGLDIFLTIIIILVSLTIIGYVNVMNNLQSLRSNWEVNKCNPLYFPFVHIINPDPNKTPEQQIKDNMDECLNSSIKDMASGTLDDMYFNFNLFNELQVAYQNFLTFIQKLFLWLFSIIAFIINFILSSLQKSFLAVTHIFLTLQDTINKFMGVLTTQFFMVLSSFVIAMSVVLNFALMTTLIIVLPLSSSIAVAALFSNIFVILFLIFLVIALVIGWLINRFWRLTALFGLLALLAIFILIASIIILIIMVLVMAALFYIQNSVQRFVGPTLNRSFG